ncbi:MAG: hypothetical protein L3J18_02865 [Candidatus Brocadia sp.]|jgi:hypothetical protein|uniref:Uncharacterized protein n=1 Tax=Candidatus Brocadia fulgida TaxID=380242 RepID=A0A0M2UZM8_9BACT|nr:MAG: hypothetical protein BROFUL_01341 [Candidatus Brocadia fulgida]UJS21269.1 MAG: hypothetical protein L3J18_02865 [Candidatus Brocadia sp.]
MSNTRINILLPEDVAQILSTVKNKSAYIAEAIKEKKLHDEKKRLRNKLEAAYKAAVNEDYEVYKEWEDTLSDGLEE